MIMVILTMLSTCSRIVKACLSGFRRPFLLLAIVIIVFPLILLTSLRYQLAKKIINQRHYDKLDTKTLVTSLQIISNTQERDVTVSPNKPATASNRTGLTKNDIFLDRTFSDLHRHTSNDIDISELGVGDIATLDLQNNERCEEIFQGRYRSYCEQVSSLLYKHDTNYSRSSCPCVPTTLVGRRLPSLNSPTLTQLVDVHPELQERGHWYPSWCEARQKVAVIIPYRNRIGHLTLLLQNLHPVLQRQLLDYTIFVVEQAGPMTIFNKGTLMNAGFTEVKRRGPFDCYIFHDVDMLAEDDRNMYTCSKSPRHLGGHINKWNYIIWYDRIFGGVTAFTEKQFQLVNGFSNEFTGWGGEDDDMRFRIDNQNLTVLRHPACVSRYTMITHEKDQGNPYAKNRLNSWSVRPDIYAVNGLSNLEYSIEAVKCIRTLYTWILVQLPPPSV